MSKLEKFNGMITKTHNAPGSWLVLDTEVKTIIIFAIRLETRVTVSSFLASMREVNFLC